MNTPDEPQSNLDLHTRVAKSRKRAWVDAAVRTGKNLESFMLDAADEKAAEVLDTPSDDRRE